MTQEELTMTVPTSQGDIKIYIPGSRDVIVKMSGGADSSILMFLLAKYRQEYNPNINFKIVSTVATLKPYQFIFAKQVVEFIDNIYPLGEYEHHSNECFPVPGIADGADENGVDLNADAYANAIAAIAEKMHNNTAMQWMGITANPSVTDRSHWLNTGRDTARDKDVAVPVRQYNIEPDVFKNNRPFADKDKKVVAELYNKYNLTDTLFALTRSCESFEFDETFSEHCGKCWWCKERKWAFGKLA